MGDRIAGVQLLAPYGEVSGKIGGTPLRTSASGMGDVTGVFLVNVFGAPALTAQEFRTWEAGAYLTASLAVTGPTGSYDRDAILNLGKNRWSYKPQLAYGVPLAEGTLLAVNGNVQFYGDADNPGESALEQKPLYGLDMHLSTNVGSRMWLSIDANYARGGRTGSGGIWKDNGQRTTHAKDGREWQLCVFAEGGSERFSQSHRCQTRCHSGSDQCVGQLQRCF